MTQESETPHPEPQEPQQASTRDLLRMVEAILFAATEPLKESDIAERLPDGADVSALLAALVEEYRERGVNLVRRGNAWLFQTAPDLAFLMRREVDESKRLSRAAVETLAIVAYHQPVSRADIEDIRGVTLSKGTLDLLMEAGWVKPVGRREAPGRPVVYGTTPEFLAHFGLESIKDLPGLEELKAAGLLEPLDVQLAQQLANAQAAQPRAGETSADGEDSADAPETGAEPGESGEGQAAPNPEPMDGEGEDSYDPAEAGPHDHHDHEA